MLDFKYLICGLLFYFNFAYACHYDVTVNDTKHVINQTNYNDIIAIYGQQRLMKLHRPSETPLYFICYTDKQEGGKFTFFVFNTEKQNVLVAVSVSSLTLRATEENACLLTGKQLAFKINHHQLDESNPTPTNKINYQKEQALVKEPFCRIKEKFNYFKNSLIKYEVYLNDNN